VTAAESRTGPAPGHCFGRTTDARCGSAPDGRGSPWRSISEVTLIFRPARHRPGWASAAVVDVRSGSAGEPSSPFAIAACEAADNRTLRRHPRSSPCQASCG
jgi:hypothetical protein